MRGLSVWPGPSTLRETTSRPLLPGLSPSSRQDHRSGNHLRDEATELLVKDMAHMSLTGRKWARQLITGVLDEAVKAGKLPKHHLADIPLADKLR